MDYKFTEIEKKWQDNWKSNHAYKVANQSDKPKYYVLDMFPYPSGTGLHVGHPLGYIASDIYSRYKRLKGFNVLHPMGFDSFGLPAEQYAIETGQHPATTTNNNIATFKAQLDKIGFCYDWDREVRTSDAAYYKWTQWIFLEIFNSYFDAKANKAKPIADLETAFETNGNIEHPSDTVPVFTEADWRLFDFKKQQEILMEYRLAFSKYGEVNWCEVLGTVLANDEVVNGVSERGGHAVVKKKMRQWYLRITQYADRLLEGLETVDFSDSMKEMQRNWIGKSVGAEITFPLSNSPRRGEDLDSADSSASQVSKENVPGRGYAKYGVDNAMNFENAKINRKNPTEAESIMWNALKSRNTGYKFRGQHPIENYIIDFICLDVWLVIEIDGGYHNIPEQKNADEIRDSRLRELGFTVLRFTNDEITDNLENALKTIHEKADELKQSAAEKTTDAGSSSPLQGEEGVTVYTTRPDTIFGVDFMVLAPELNLVQQIKTTEQSTAVDEYITYVKSRSDVDRMAEKKITGCFTGAYAVNPFDGREIPIYISEYVLAGYGTGAIMAVPCGDERDFKFAQHFNIPITNIIGNHFNGEVANATKEAILENSGFLNGKRMMEASELVLQKLEEQGIGKRKVNYRMRDAGFSRQRYWGEPFPIIWSDGIAIPLDADELPLELPHVDKYGPGPEGEGPLANITDWVNLSDLTPGPSPKETGTTPQGSMESEAIGEHTITSREEPGYFNSTVQEWRNTLPFAKENRTNSPDAENIIWQQVRDRKIDGFKFRRQHPVAGYIPDFICLEKKLILEIDGEYHNVEDQQKFDKARENWLKENGFAMLRFTNDEVKNNLKEVVKKISQPLQQEKNLKVLGSNSPLPWRGAGGEVKRETSTMPGYAGSSWYFLRYMDPHNADTFCDRKASDYWNQVDLYIGGTEHAVGHLLYSRLWTKVLFDLGHIGYEEPFKKLLNQGMIQGSSRFVYRIGLEIYSAPGILSTPVTYVTKSIADKIKLGDEDAADEIKDFSKKILEKIYGEDKGIAINAVNIIEHRVDIKYVDGFELNIDGFKKWRDEYSEANFFLEDDGKYICGAEVEKMSKSKYNTVNPDELCNKYGADTFRMYEMFLGPVEASKPWDTKGIEGVHRFLRKLWRLFFDENKGAVWTALAPSPLERAGGEASDAELKILHKAIKKIEEDTERFSFNTAVSTFMICVNELWDIKCHKKEILENVLILLTPYAPHIAEELWSQLNNSGSILDASYPIFENKYVTESSKEYPISINGKVRANISMALDMDQTDVEKIVLANETIQKWLEGKAPKKIIYVRNKMINVVV